MKNFLYLSPYFPPDARVGALRPLKFVRHLPALGLRPVVLADAPEGRFDQRLLGAIPAEVLIVRDYGARTQRRWRRLARAAPQAEAVRPAALELPLAKRLLRSLEQPELVPLGPHALDIPHALRAARALIERHHCSAILVNADPFASAVVGALASRLTGVPLVVDFRDPWALCSLRRPLRKPWVERSVDALERFVVTTARDVILNTQSARELYAAHYAELGEARFSCIPNHADPTLFTPVGPASAPSEQRPFELLFAGTLRRFVDGQVLLDLLAALGRRGVGPDRVRLTITGSTNEALLARALQLGLGAYVHLEPPASYLDIAARQQRAGALLVLGHRDQQRIPAKLYDAALSDRPLLVVSENPELVELSQSIGGARVFAHDQAEPMAGWLEQHLSSGASPCEARSFRWTSAEASRKLAEILQQACLMRAA
jgi:hypothetical protein